MSARREQLVGRFVVRQRDDEVSVYFAVPGGREHIVAGDWLCDVRGEPGVDLWKRGLWIAERMTGPEQGRQ